MLTDLKITQAALNMRQVGLLGYVAFCVQSLSSSASQAVMAETSNA